MKQRLYRAIVNLSALAVLSYMAVDVFYRSLSLRLTAAGRQESSELSIPDMTPTARPPLTSFDVIVDRNLFGSNEGAADAPPPREIRADTIEALEPTSLNIILLGTVSGAEDDSWAVIQESGRNNQGLYRVGDAVQDALILKILRGSVVLRVADRHEILSMEKPDAAGSSEAGGAAASGHGGDTITVARSDIQKSLQDISTLLTQARIRPHLKDGRPDGFMLSYIKRNSFFSQLGLKQGDIVKRINGRPINTPEDAFSFYKSIESGEPLAMEIRRDGEAQTIQYRFK